jgi:hypothetical protein
MLLDDRCPRCGARLALVGRLHLCRRDVRLGGAVDLRGVKTAPAVEPAPSKTLEKQEKPIRSLRQLLAAKRAAAVAKRAQQKKNRDISSLG